MERQVSPARRRGEDVFGCRHDNPIFVIKRSEMTKDVVRWLALQTPLPHLLGSQPIQGRRGDA